MIRFPKRPRAKSIDLEDGDVVELSSVPDPDELADTGVVPPKPQRARSLAPLSMESRPQEETFLIPRAAPKRTSRVAALLALAGDRPSLPWAAMLLALGAIGAAVSMRLLDALDDHALGQLPVAAAEAPPAPLAVAAPMSLPAKPAPVVLKFGADDAVTVAVDAPKPAAPPPPAPASAPPPPVPVVITAAPASVAKKPPAVAAAPPSAPAPAAGDAAKRAQSVDSLAEQQLKAALR